MRAAAAAARPRALRERRHRAPVLLVLALALAAVRGSVRRPSVSTHTIDFEGESAACDFPEGTLVSQQYAAQLARFSGPGFGSLNGGVIAHRCALGGGAFPPLSNASLAGAGFLGFSTLHSLAGRAGKPISPETIRFDVRMTNLALWVAGIDGHAVRFELWSGPFDSFDDKGVLLHTIERVLTPELQRVDMVDPADIFVDCVRRLVIYSAAKIYVVDDLTYAETASDDGTCGPEPGAAASPPPPGALRNGAGRARSTPGWAAAAATLAAVGVSCGARRRRRPWFS